MSLPEVYWRFQQKQLMTSEKKQFATNLVRVDEELLYKDLMKLREFNSDALGINWNHSETHPKTSIQLLGPFDYESNKMNWHGGFQTSNQWPVKFAYDLGYKQCDDIGDARTNWELHRHFQFSVLAKAYYQTNDKAVLNEFEELFEDWNKSNPWLHGIAWVSVMEVAIRAISWMYTLAFLKKANNVSQELVEKLDTGVKNMIHYVSLHYSRYSSANNHLLVEATAIGLAGFVYDSKEWIDLSVALLDEELDKQNFDDGVNKEVSLHYQTFVMEAYALMMHAMNVNDKDISKEWSQLLHKMCSFVDCSMYTSTKACAFGDNDEGKILDLDGSHFSHYAYVLQFCSLLLNKRYHAFDKICDNIQWLFTPKQISAVQELTKEKHTSRIFPTGGYSFLRSNDEKVLIGIDHAPLGFGSIAAHGHADALSFQLFVDDNEVFVDPGTYIYHCWLDKRDAYRTTLQHNTVELENTNQSQMLGAFLWGKRAECEVLSSRYSEAKDTLIAKHNGYSTNHQREFEFDKKQNLVIKDSFDSTVDFVSTFMIGPKYNVLVESNVVKVVHKMTDAIIATLSTGSDIKIRIEDEFYSPEYGVEQPIKAIRLYGNSNKINTSITILK